MSKPKIEMTELRDHRVYILTDGLYWRPNGLGYTESREEAGIYRLYDALQWTAHIGPEKHVQFEDVEMEEGRC